MTAHDPRLELADSWHKHHVYLERQLDTLTMESRYAREQAVRLRDEVRREVEARDHQARADAELERGGRRRAA